MAAIAALPVLRRQIRDVADVRALFVGIAHAPLERCGFAYLDPKWRLLGVFETHATEIDGAAVPVRRVIAEAIALEAASVIMAHNHPSGDPTPSAPDLAVTRRLSIVLDAIDARLVDHVVLAGDRWCSLREMGCL